MSTPKRSYTSPQIVELGSADSLTQQISPVLKPGTNPDFGTEGSFFYNVSTGEAIGT